MFSFDFKWYVSVWVQEQGIEANHQTVSFSSPWHTFYTTVPTATAYATLLNIQNILISVGLSILH